MCWLYAAFLCESRMLYDGLEEPVKPTCLSVQYTVYGRLNDGAVKVI